MTMQNTTIEETKPSARALFGMTIATLALLVGALLWQQGRFTGEPAAPGATATVGTANEGTASMGEGATRTTTDMTDRDGEPAAAPHTLVVAAPDNIPEAYVQLVERHGALDGATPLAVTIVVGGAAPATGRGDCGSTAGTTEC
jgi:ABC-type Fe3+-hydroxamate transport system substrate-binding protein